MIKRFEHNPIITKKNVSYKVNSIFNPGAIKLGDEYILLCRVEMPNGRSSLALGKSNDGINFLVSEKPVFTPADHGEYYEYVEWGIEDARINKVEDKIYITYTGYSKYLPLIMLAETEDFEKFNILGPISEPSNKDCSLFPEKIEGYYWKMDRPSIGSVNSIWLNRSKDLIHWGGFRFVTSPFEGTWAGDKIGGSTPPVKTEKGWLFLFHGVRGFGISNIYKIGAMLTDLKEPWKILGKSWEPILSPETEYERVGDVQNVVFTNGWVIEDNGDVKIYYSGADTNICLAETTINHLLSLCE